MISRVINGDSYNIIKCLNDNEFDLAIIDPPYGIGEDGKKNHSRSRKAKAKEYTPKKWDREPPPLDFFKELKRVSKNQIIFGANHFITRIPEADSPSWIVWDKLNGDNDFADCELAHTSFKGAVRRYAYRWAGMLQGNMKKKENRIHPTQKPTALYSWILRTFAKEGDHILDTHLGSGSIRIACDILDFDFTGIEKDEEYFIAQEERFREHKAQGRLF